MGGQQSSEQSQQNPSHSQEVTSPHLNPVTTHNPVECSVCYIPYDQSERRPRTLPCGHTFCSACMSQLITANQLSCPDCRICHTATSVDQIPISYVLEAVIQRLKQLQQAQEAAVAFETGDGTIHEMSSGISRKLWSLLEEQKSRVSRQAIGCQGTQSQLDQYRTQLADCKDQHLQLQSSLQDLMQRNTDAMTLIEQEDARVVAMKEEGKEKESQLEATLRCLANANSAQDIGGAIGHADQSNVQVKDWRHRCQELFPDTNTVATSWKVCEDIKTALDMVSVNVDATHIPTSLPHPDLAFTIMDNVNTIKKRMEQITVNQLLRMSWSTRRLVEAGLIFAVQKDESCLRFSKITLSKDRLYLTCLQDQPPPSHARIIPVSEVVGVVDPSFILAFLDLAWGGSTRGRVHIRLSPYTPLSQQFFMLCTGQRGVSYLNTRLQRVKDRRVPGDCVSGGQYARTEGPGIMDVTWEYRKSNRAGAVMGFPGDATKAAQFIITTKSLDGAVKCPNVFGEVENGLEVVREVFIQNNNTQVTVVDCGIVLNR